MDERQWIHAIQKGDKRFLEDIAEKYYDDIFRFCAFQTGSGEAAWDLAQETFLRFIRYVEGYHDRNLKGYLLTIAMNVCRDYLRKRGLEDRRPLEQADWEAVAEGGGPEPPAQSDPERRAVEADVRHRLMEALAKLPQMQREAILLRYLYDMKYREIGRLTDASVSTVKSRVRQGTDRLQGLLRREDFLD